MDVSYWVAITKSADEEVPLNGSLFSHAETLQVLFFIQCIGISRYVNDPLADWQAASKQNFDLVNDPEGHWRKSVDLAELAHERRQVSSDELSEMLELDDAARLWGLVECEEADGVGLFLDQLY